MIHPARAIPFAELYKGLRANVGAGLISERCGANGLRLYCYSRSAVFDRQWNEFTLMSRGLILDVERGCIVATPFPKFFNVGERGDAIPDLPFETFEKVDGSLIIIFHHDGRWRTATKGSLDSEQAQWAAAKIPQGESILVPGFTYLAEAIYPENRIVVRYEEQGLVLLGAYAENGVELGYAEIQDTARSLGWRAAMRHGYVSVSDLIARAASLPVSEEGFVLRFENGLRLKIKGDEYKRIHALISRCTPLAMWEAMAAGDDLQAVRRDLPEEFWADFDGIIAALQASADGIVAATSALAATLSGLSDKEVGLRLSELPAEVRPFIFPFRKNGGDLLSGRTRQALFRAIRPTGNNLPGYVPSYAINRVVEEAA